MKKTSNTNSAPEMPSIPNLILPFQKRKKKEINTPLSKKIVKY